MSRHFRVVETGGACVGTGILDGLARQPGRMDGYQSDMDTAEAMGANAARAAACGWSLRCLALGV